MAASCADQNRDCSHSWCCPDVYDFHLEHLLHCPDACSAERCTGLQDLLGYRLDDSVDRARVRKGFLSTSQSRTRLSHMGGSQNGAATPDAFV